MMMFIGLWSHSISAILFGALSVWLVQRWFGERNGKMLILACITTAFWSLAAGSGGQTSYLAQLSEHFRNLAWLGFMYTLWRQGDGERRSYSVMVLYAVLGAIIVVEIGTDIIPVLVVGSPRLLGAAFLTSAVLHMLVAVGALVLVHNPRGASGNPSADGRASGTVDL
jgi:hypothetical protein